MPSKKRDNICSARNGAKKHVLIDLVVHEIEIFWLEGRSGGIDRAESSQLVLFVGVNVCSLQALNILGGCAKDGDPENYELSFQKESMATLNRRQVAIDIQDSA